MTPADARAATIAGVRAAGPVWWLAAVAVSVLAAAIDFVAVPAWRGGSSGVLAALVVARIVLALWTSYAAMRRIGGSAHPLAPTRALALYAGYTALVALLYGAASEAVAWGAGPPPATLAGQWLAIFLFGAAWGVALAPLTGLAAGYAGGLALRDTAAAVRATRGSRIALALAFAQLVLPFAAIHLALALLPGRLPLTVPALAALALIDGVASGVQLLLTAALSVAAWRLFGSRFP